MSTTKKPAPTPETGKAAPGTHAVRTPWGSVQPTVTDQHASDPFEPEAPLSPAQLAARAAATKAQADSPAPLSPRELYEMLMTPAALPRTRSSPLHKWDDAAQKPPP